MTLSRQAKGEFPPREGLTSKLEEVHTIHLQTIRLNTRESGVRKYRFKHTWRNRSGGGGRKRDEDLFTPVSEAAIRGILIIELFKDAENAKEDRDVRQLKA